ncbi:MAG: sodium-dependent transporter [Bacteroidaceae bacterium]|nr:sodium-dependent transporter [Bacteroidaceae bacterium]
MEKHVNFGSRMGAIFAAAGSAVGLGNIWRFPMLVGDNGGAAFILIYIMCILLVGIPIMVGEFVIGRHTQSNMIDAFRQLAPGKWWRVIGVMGIGVAFIILSYYLVVSGWTLYYAYSSFSGALSNPECDYGAFFGDYVANPWLSLISAVVFMLMTHLIIIRGVQEGIEKCSKILMPMLLLIIGILVVCTFSMPGINEGLTFLLKPDFSKLNFSVILAAMGQAFYSLSVAMGCLCTYASYFNKNTRLVSSALSVSSIDTSVAILSGFIIFPAVFSVPHVEANAGPGLVFQTLPYVFNMAFGNIPILGYIFSGLFYVLLFLAALTSAISLHEAVTAYVLQNWKMSRKKASTIVSACAMTLGIFCCLSFGVLSHWTIFGLTIFDLFDTVSSNIILPLGGVLLALFVGWYLNRELVRKEITNNGEVSQRIFPIIIFLLRWVAPIAILSMFIKGLIEMFNK